MLVKVAFPAWAETSTSWKLLTKRNTNKDGFSDSDWFPKNQCKLAKSETEIGVGILDIPDWLLLKKQEKGLKFTDLKDNIF
jgi:hypothetical protein